MRKGNERGLSAKKRLFCRLYYDLQNGREAAIRAGYPAREAAKTAAELLGQPAVLDELRTIGEEQARSVQHQVRAGLHRLAFGQVTDAVRLAIDSAGEPAGREGLDALDLFNVAELKTSRSGQFEIKFFDRMRALEKLWELGAAGESETMASFLGALRQGAEAVRRAEDRPDGCAL